MAQNPSLNQLVTALNAAPHPAMGTAYFAHVGSYLALARSIPPAWFPKTGTATEAQIGGLIANLHSLTTVAWEVTACAKGEAARRNIEEVAYALHGNGVLLPGIIAADTDRPNESGQE